MDAQLALRLLSHAVQLVVSDAELVAGAATERFDEAFVLEHRVMTRLILDALEHNKL